MRRSICSPPPAPHLVHRDAGQQPAGRLRVHQEGPPWITQLPPAFASAVPAAPRPCRMRIAQEPAATRAAAAPDPAEPAIC